MYYLVNYLAIACYVIIVLNVSTYILDLYLYVSIKLIKIDGKKNFSSQ